MNRLLLIACLAGFLLGADAPQEAYLNDFEKVAPGKPPDELLVLNGDFKVKEEAGNRFLEVDPDPLDALGLLFGPDGVTLADVKARIFATSTGRRFPEIGIGCGDAGGYKLFLLPGQKNLELRKGDESVAAAPCDTWQSGQWMSFRLKVTPAGEGKWRIEGKAWPASAKEPQAWGISYETTEAPPSGRASIWASPFSGTPVRFDDLSVAGPAKP